MKVRVTLVYAHSGHPRVEVTTWPSWDEAMRWVNTETLPLERIEVIRI